jgi:hypothetical protein
MGQLFVDSLLHVDLNPVMGFFLSDRSSSNSSFSTCSPSIVYGLPGSEKLEQSNDRLNRTKGRCRVQPGDPGAPSFICWHKAGIVSIMGLIAIHSAVVHLGWFAAGNRTVFRLASPVGTRTDTPKFCR